MADTSHYILNEDKHPLRTLRVEYNEYSKEITIYAGSQGEVYQGGEVDLTLDEARILHNKLGKLIRENEE